MFIQSKRDDEDAPNSLDMEAVLPYTSNHSSKSAAPDRVLPEIVLFEITL